MKKKIISAIVICITISIAIVNTYVNYNYFSRIDVSLLSLRALAETESSTGESTSSCTSSKYGEGAFLKELTCVYTETIGGGIPTFSGGYKKCCTKGEGAPPQSSCYADKEQVCRKGS